MSSRPSLDKVISYDTTSLLEDIPEKVGNREKENKNMKNVPDLKLNKSKLTRPQTTKQKLNYKTINEEFNEKLI